MKSKVFLLIDAQSFYVSCERAFRAELRNKPVVVLSSNDGNLVALSAEAKRLGLRRGQPFFQVRKLVRTHGIWVFSSNYPLYYECSQRMMRSIAELAPCLEEYSIDEAFAEVSDQNIANLRAFALQLKVAVYRDTGIPVRIAAAPTKCLAKIGCELLKANAGYGDVLDLTSFTREELDTALASVAIEDVWGIGTKYAHFLRNYGIATACDLRDADSRWIRKHLTVVGARIQLELQGISCIPLETSRKPKRQIICAKSFGRPVVRLEELEEAACWYVARAAEKLRAQDSLCGRISVFVQTNPFDKEAEYYANEFTIDLPHPTGYTPNLFKQARRALAAIYRPGYHFKKVGVILSDITPLPVVQPDLFGEVSLGEHVRQMRLMAVIDALNGIFGQGTLVFAIQGFARTWRMRQDMLSQRYLSRWEEVLTI